MSGMVPTKDRHAVGGQDDTAPSVLTGSSPQDQSGEKGQGPSSAHVEEEEYGRARLRTEPPGQGDGVQGSGALSGSLLPPRLSVTFVPQRHWLPSPRHPSYIFYVSTKAAENSKLPKNEKLFKCHSLRFFIIITYEFGTESPA